MREEMPVYRQIALAASVCLIKLHLAAGDHAAALTEIEGIERWARQHGHGRLLITLCILAAHAHRLAGEQDKAISRFDEAVSMSMFQGFIGPFLDCWRFMSRRPRPTTRAMQRRARRIASGRISCAGCAKRSSATRPGTRAGAPQPVGSLTLQHLDQGYTNKEIARLLKISPNTVKYRLKSLYEKLGVNSRRDAVRYSREHNLVNPE